MTMRKALLIAVSLFASAALGGCVYWQGGYPAEEIGLTVVDENGAAIRDAQLSVVDASGELAYDGPVVEHTPHTPLATDGLGQIRLHVRSSRFGGKAFFLGIRAPKWSLVIHKDGFEACEIELPAFEGAQNAQRAEIHFPDGSSEEGWTCDRKVILSRD